MNHQGIENKTALGTFSFQVIHLFTGMPKSFSAKQQVNKRESFSFLSKTGGSLKLGL